MEQGRSLLDHAALVLDLERLLKRPSMWRQNAGSAGRFGKKS